MNLILNVYDATGKNIEKQHKSTTYDLMFGTITNLMELLKIEDIENPFELLKTINSAWGEITTVLSGVFPDVQADEWKRVKVKELIPIIVEIAKYSVTEMFTIPTEKN